MSVRTSARQHVSTSARFDGRGRADVRRADVSAARADVAARRLRFAARQADRSRPAAAAGAGRRLRHALRAELRRLPRRGRARSAPRGRSTIPSICRSSARERMRAGHGRTASRHVDAGLRGVAPGGMLTDEQIGIIVDGMIGALGRRADAQRRRRCRRTPHGAPAIAQRGAAAYATYCAGCHGADGTGGPQGGSVVDGVYLGAGQRSGAAHARSSAAAPTSACPTGAAAAGQPMSEQEISDVVAWLVAQAAAVSLMSHRHETLRRWRR